MSPPPAFSSFIHSHDLPLCAGFFVLSNLAPSFRTSSSHLFLGLPAGHLPPRLPSRTRRGILLSSILTTCPAQCNLSTCIYQSIVFIASCSSSLYRRLQTALACTGPNILLLILYGQTVLQIARCKFLTGVSPKIHISRDLDTVWNYGRPIFNRTDRLKNYLVMFLSCNIEILKYHVKSHSTKYKNECEVPDRQMAKLERWSPVI